LGVIACEVTCFVMGCGMLLFAHTEPAARGHREDHILISTDKIALLRGDEGTVNSVTHGRFSLHFPHTP
ncbi:hypothetical protein F5J12DRAFT_698332, partial [Pisolithus orientalis]|uniref:uncharacterized protein n=1 Tax=Pisolithus orientalis TaxID=936130 RepID=UPI002224B457